MRQIQAPAIPRTQKDFLPQFIPDFRAALSYLSFYSADSPFVIQALQKIHKDFQRLLMAVDPLVFFKNRETLYLNDADLSGLGDLLKIFRDKNIPGVEIRKELTSGELSIWLKQITSAAAISQAEKENPDSHIHVLASDDVVAVSMIEETSVTPEPVDVPSLKNLFSTKPPSVSVPNVLTESNDSKGKKVLSLPKSVNSVENTPSPTISTFPHPSVEVGTHEILLSFVAEAWQYSQLQKKTLEASPRMANLIQSFDRLFDRLLSRLEKNSPDLAGIYQWFHTPQGRLLEVQAVSAMYPLLEVAVKNGWTAVLFDPATEGLVNDCLVYWGANGRHDLVEKTVSSLTEGLGAGSIDRQIALSHLRDARPWVRNAGLLEKVLGRLNALLANETSAGLYQEALLFAWDLTEPALEAGKEGPVLTLLSTLHFHGEEDTAVFPERASIARHWLFERSTPPLIRRFVSCARQAGRLGHLPLLGEMAAPLFLEDFLGSKPPQKAEYFNLFAEWKEPIRSVVAERLADIREESEVKKLIPVLRVCGMDAGLSLQLSSWLSKGSRELKADLLAMIEEGNDPAGGIALRLALFDDDGETAAMAARIVGKIHFAPGLKVLLKAAEVREHRYPDDDAFRMAVCQSLGDLGQAEGLPFLEDIARKKPLLRGKNFSLPVRLEAIRALSKINQPEAWHFLETLTDEKTPEVQETIEKIIHEKSGSPP